MNRSLALVLGASATLFACGSETPVAPPAAAPTPAPAPAPSATPRAFSCPLPALPDFGGTCPKLRGEHWQIVDAAIEQVIREHPEYFNLDNDGGGGTFQVLDRSRYIGAVITALHARGICAREELEEIQVKTTNDFNEQYAIWSSWGHIRRGPGSYITTCFPARF